VAILLFERGMPQRHRPPKIVTIRLRLAPRGWTTAEEAILELTAANAASSEEDLPEDYEAIQDLFLGG
jgi:hypothetical protein